MVCQFPKVKFAKSVVSFECTLPNLSVGELSLVGTDPNDRDNPTIKADSSSIISAEMWTLVLGSRRVARHLLDVLALS